MQPSNNPLIEQLAADLAPVRTLKTRDGLLLIALAAIATVLVVAFFHGVWMDGLTGRASPIYYIVNGLLLVLGLASATSVIALARPQVGNHHDGPRWALAMVGVVPAVTVITLALRSNLGLAMSDANGLACFSKALVAAIFTAIALVLWLRRGAPVSLQVAGLQTGIAAGALGSVAYGMSCSLDTLAHVGIWHVAPVAVAGALGRLIVPRLVRW